MDKLNKSHGDHGRSEKPQSTLAQRFLSFLYSSDKKSTVQTATTEAAGFDYFNELPDEILEEILSRLNVRDAVRSSIVSRRWRNLAGISTTHETAPSMRCDEHKSSGAAVVRLTDDHMYRTTSGSAILVYETDKTDYCPIDYFRLDYWIWDFTNHKFRIFLAFPRLLRLTSLYLDGLHKTSYRFSGLLASCSALETLSVRNSSGLRIPDLYKLKHLEVRHCANVTICYMPNLVSLKLAQHWDIPVNIHENPKLSIVSLEEDTTCKYMIPEIQRKAPQVEQLELNYMDLIREISEIQGLDTANFINVKHLRLVFRRVASLMRLLSFIRACPNLQKLTLVYGVRNKGENDDDDHDHIYFPERLMVYLQSLMYRHQSLKVVEFIGWRGSENEVQFANFVIKTAIHLEDLVFERADAVDENAAASARVLMNKFEMIKSSKAQAS